MCTFFILLYFTDRVGVIIPGVEGRHDGPPPVDGDGEHGEHRARHRAQGDELVQGAVEGAVMPLPAQTCQPCLTMSMFRMESTLLTVGAKSGQITFYGSADFCVDNADF